MNISNAGYLPEESALLLLQDITGNGLREIQPKALGRMAPFLHPDATFQVEFPLGVEGHPAGQKRAAAVKVTATVTTARQEQITGVLAIYNLAGDSEEEIKEEAFGQIRLLRHPDMTLLVWTVNAEETDPADLEATDRYEALVGLKAVATPVENQSDQMRVQLMIDDLTGETVEEMREKAEELFHRFCDPHGAVSVDFLTEVQPPPPMLESTDRLWAQKTQVEANVDREV